MPEVVRAEGRDAGGGAGSRDRRPELVRAEPGNFAQGAYFFDRSFAIESSRDAGWVTDETVFRGVQRFGFAVVVPAAFEVLSGIEP